MAASNIPEISAVEHEIKRRGRRRLIGAVTIGLLAIVFLPMIFDSEPRRSGTTGKTQDISVQVPSKEGQPALPAPTAAPVVVPATPLAAPSSPPASAEVSKAVAAAAGTAVPAPAALPEKAAPRETAKPSPSIEKTAKAVATPVTEKTGFVVQLGVFSDADNARQVIAKMKEAKLAVYTESIPIKSGAATRVRVGPFASRDKADAALAQVKLTGADGKIVPLK